MAVMTRDPERLAESCGRMTAGKVTELSSISGNLSGCPMHGNRSLPNLEQVVEEAGNMTGESRGRETAENPCRASFNGFLFRDRRRLLFCWDGSGSSFFNRPDPRRRLSPPPALLTDVSPAANIPENCCGLPSEHSVIVLDAEEQPTSSTSAADASITFSTLIFMPSPAAITMLSFISCPGAAGPP
jgi:hypothetical protein